MQLFINDEQVDVQFDTEKNLIDVYQSIEAEVGRHSRYILECRVDDREVSGEFLKQTSIDGVDRIQFFVGDSQAVLLRTARTIDRYLDRIGNALFYTEELTADDLGELQTGASWILEFVEAASRMLGIDSTRFTVPMPDGTRSSPIAGVLQTLKEDLAALKPGETGQETEAVLNSLRALKSFTSRIIIRLNADLLTGDEISAGIDAFARVLPELQERIVKVNERYQSGRDEEAVQLLDSVMDEMDRYMPFVFGALERIPEEIRNSADSHQEVAGESEGKSLEETAALLIGLFGDLSSALEEGDLVAAGDILEYELADRLGRLLPFLAGLKKFLPEDRPERQP